MRLSTGKRAALLGASGTLFLLLDYQSGLSHTVKDVPVANLRKNVVILAKLATVCPGTPALCGIMNC